MNGRDTGSIGHGMYHGKFSWKVKTLEVKNFSSKLSSERREQSQQEKQQFWKPGK